MACRWIEQTFRWNHEGVNRLAGSIAWVAGLILQLTATQYVRRRWYTVRLLPHCFHGWFACVGVLGFRGLGLSWFGVNAVVHVLCSVDSVSVQRLGWVMLQCHLLLPTAVRRVCQQYFSI